MGNTDWRIMEAVRDHPDRYRWVCECGDLSAPDSIGECARCKRIVLGWRQHLQDSRA